MTLFGKKLTAATLTALCGSLLSVAAFAQQGPNAWLDRMANAVQTINYEGTVIRISNGRAEALKVVHTVSDGVIRERVIAQEGNGLEIIRNGNEVHCILPESRSVLVEEWNDQSTLFSTLPSSSIRFGSEYDVSIAREERVAGRAAVLLVIRPHDEYRYGHHLWLDTETGFPLQTQLIGEDGTALEQVKFADISLGREILVSELTPSYSTENFRWFNSPRREVTPVAGSDWEIDNPPAGFRLVSAQQESMPGSEHPVIHLMYSDGLASVSVFVVVHTGEPVVESTQIGASHTFSRIVGEYRITAVGEVPAATVEHIVDSM